MDLSSELASSKRVNLVTYSCLWCPGGSKEPEQDGAQVVTFCDIELSDSGTYLRAHKKSLHHVVQDP